MPSIAVITDSTADLPREMAEGAGLRVVPLNVHFGDETFLDGVDLTSDAFLERLPTARQMPRTSQPSPEAFRRAYREAVDGGADGIVCVTISSKLSGTYNSATLAAREFEAAPVRVVDSLSASLGLGFAALAAAERARTGGTLEDVEREARETAARTEIMLYVDTLEYLQRNGRIGRAQRLVGGLLDIKPVLVVRDGEVESHQRTRTRGKALQTVLAWATSAPRERLGVIWSTVEADRDLVLDGLGALIPRDEIVVSKIGPVIGAHTGPGAGAVIVVNPPA